MDYRQMAAVQTVLVSMSGMETGKADALQQL